MHWPDRASLTPPERKTAPSISFVLLLHSLPPVFLIFRCVRKVIHAPTGRASLAAGTFLHASSGSANNSASATAAPSKSPTESATGDLISPTGHRSQHSPTHR
jgi:hypothetical protein